MHVANPDGDPYDRCRRCGEDRLEIAVSRDQAAAGSVYHAAKSQAKRQAKRPRGDGR
jgi:hypothetical protein